MRSTDSSTKIIASYVFKSRSKLQFIQRKSCDIDLDVGLDDVVMSSLFLQLYSCCFVMIVIIDSWA